jgi:hypothetical protein
MNGRTVKGAPGKPSSLVSWPRLLIFEVQLEARVLGRGVSPCRGGTELRGREPHDSFRHGKHRSRDQPDAVPRACLGCARHVGRDLCVNNQGDQALGETAMDCGGSCLPCETGSACKVNADCLTSVCKANFCQAPTCMDGARNGNETGLDCGGLPSCPRCPTGQGCKVGSDCESGVCWAGACEPPKCTDGIKNGDEADWDCGGACPPCP